MNAHLALTTLWAYALLMGSASAQKPPENPRAQSPGGSPTPVQNSPAGRYAEVNGLKLYYEIHGRGAPIVLIHGGGSTIESSFGRILPELARTRQVIAVELQAHGHTLDIGRPLSFEQDADDVAALLQQLHVEKADILGFSNGGTTALQIAIRHPARVNRLVLVSATFKRDGLIPGFFEGFQHASLEQTMPPPLKDAYLKANPDPRGLQTMFDRDVARMVAFKDISATEIKAIRAPTLVINSEADVVRAEHARELARTLPQTRLAILPGAHGECIGEICTYKENSQQPAQTVALIEDFLKR